LHALDPPSDELEPASMRLQTLFEARWIFAVLVLLGALSLLLTPWLALLFLVLIGYTFAFFRDPERIPPADADVVVAAADGVVVEVADLEESEVVRATMRRVAIFLSVFDVHTNRAPIDGRIIYREHHAGLCLDARNPDCSVKNEAMTWAFENPRATLVVRQITGAIARRIVGWSKISIVLETGSIDTTAPASFNVNSFNNSARSAARRSETICPIPTRLSSRRV